MDYLKQVRAFAQDATGAKTGTITNVTAAEPGTPTPADLGGDAAGHNK
ncbi:MAG: hypothetical protein ACXVJD_02995 [Mucilaginibacter sp.]